MASLLCIFLIDNCYESAQLTVDGVTFGMVPCAIGKQDEQAMKDKPVSNIPPWTLHQLPPLGSCPSFLSVMACDLRVVNWDKPFPPQFDLVTFFYFFFFFFFFSITVTETLSKTVSFHCSTAASLIPDCVSSAPRLVFPWLHFCWAPNGTHFLVYCTSPTRKRVSWGHRLFLSFSHL